MSIRKVHPNITRHIFLHLYILSCLLCAAAQSYITLDDKAFYFMEKTNVINFEFFSLDLTISWNAAKAPLQSLPAPPVDPNAPLAPVAVNYDKNSLLYFISNMTPSVYNITTQTWQQGTQLTDPNSVIPRSSLEVNHVATDPSTGIAYIPSVDNTDKFSMYTYNTLQRHTSSVTKTIVPGVPVPYHGYSAVWSISRKSVLFYGGQVKNQRGDQYVGLMEYRPSNSQWSSVTAQGVITPGNVTYGCMASGHDSPPFSVFILDVKTLVWTKGAGPKLDQERWSATCTVVNDYFIVVGGSRSGFDLQRVIVYNIKLDEWTDSYEAPEARKTPSTTETAEQGNPSAEGMTSGMKIGMIAGGSSTLVFILICGAFLVRRRKMRKTSQADVIDKNYPKDSLGLAEKNKNNPHYPPYPGEDIDPYISQYSTRPKFDNNHMRL
ncbi:hypothetical protein BGZ72_011109 [Mortierella alpina]|nr:hypothetical protein BGZ72_011109 [Mortierella alpina]